ncbi:MAG: uroporphyrinogen-III C-methyltransferase [Bacteroidetes bacterium]|nr:uroporphyrinogen-III C-methyltransferase [Bacteroidota bacterium]
MNKIINENKNNGIVSLPVLLRNPKILLIGGGNIAFQKAEVLKQNGIDFIIIALNVSRKIKELEVIYFERELIEQDLLPFNIIIDATGNIDVKKMLRNEKSKRFFFLNTVDVPEKCDFYFSALLQFGQLKIAVSSNGASPTVSQVVRDKIKKILPVDLEEITNLKLIERNRGIISPKITANEVARLFGKVYLVGCGTGDAELLTIKALKTIELADVILYDSLITKEIMELVPENKIKIYSGKPHNSNSFSQDDINRMLIEYAKKGLVVARLKSGDPFVFGRLVEEVTSLIEHNIDYEIIPGISSALYGPGSAGIPLTARDLSANFSVISGCLKDNKLNVEWIDLLKIKNHTTVLLMGLKRINEIVNAARAIGIRENLPAAIICNASRPNQKNIITTISELSQAAEEAETPAIIVFGEVVKYSQYFLKLKSKIYK